MRQRTGLDCISFLTDVTLSPVDAQQALATPLEEMRTHLRRQIAQKKQELSALVFRLEDVEHELDEADTKPRLSLMLKSLFRPKLAADGGGTR